MAVVLWRLARQAGSRRLREDAAPCLKLPETKTERLFYPIVGDAARGVPHNAIGPGRFMMERQKKALICGMAKSGVASARLLAKDGYAVTINDMKAEIPGLMDALCGIEYTDALGQDPMELVEGQDLVVLSPVIPIFAPFAKRVH